MNFHGISRALTVVSVGQDGVKKYCRRLLLNIRVNENDLQEHCLSHSLIHGAVTLSCCRRNSCQRKRKG